MTALEVLIIAVIISFFLLGGIFGFIVTALMVAASNDGRIYDDIIQEEIMKEVKKQ